MRLSVLLDQGGEGCRRAMVTSAKPATSAVVPCAGGVAITWMHEEAEGSRLRARSPSATVTGVGLPW